VSVLGLGLCFHSVVDNLLAACNALQFSDAADIMFGLLIGGTEGEPLDADYRA